LIISATGVDTPLMLRSNWPHSPALAGSADRSGN
jgi:hypothetical protein